MIRGQADLRRGNMSWSWGTRDWRSTSSLSEDPQPIHKTMELLLMRVTQNGSTTASRLRTRSLTVSVAGLCIVLTAMIGCERAAAATGAFQSESGPIRKHPDNPHYFAYKGKPQVLITTDQHYGAVINLDFDYISFLDRLREYGMNLTRIYPGAYVEMKDQYAKGNPLGPSPGRYILPLEEVHRDRGKHQPGHV
jgi:hypothetical protein